MLDLLLWIWRSQKNTLIWSHILIQGTNEIVSRGFHKSFFHRELAMLLKQRNTTLILSCLCSLLRLAAAAADVEVVSASAVFPLQTKSQLDLCLLLTKLFWINNCRYVAKLSRIEPTLFIRMCQKRSPNQNKVIFSDPLFEKSFVSATLDKLRENSIKGGT